MQDYKTEHCCKYCKNGAYSPLSREVVCSYHGVVPRRYICKKYDFDAFKLKVRRARNLDLSKFKEEDFSIE